jgi:hypothetical protein
MKIHWKKLGNHKRELSSKKLDGESGRLYFVQFCTEKIHTMYERRFLMELTLNWNSVKLFRLQHCWSAKTKKTA